MPSSIPIEQAASAGHARTARATRVRYGVMGFLCALSFLTYFDRVCIVRAQKVIQHDLNITDTGMGLILGAFWLAYALFEIPSGWLGDRYGARGTLTRIVIAWSVFTALSGAATGFFTLLLWRFCFGVGEAGAYPNMARVQSRWLPVNSRARAGGLLWLFARWGAAFSPIIFGTLLRFADSPRFRQMLVRLHLSRAIATYPAWRIGFFFSGLLGLIWVILFYVWFRDEPTEKRSVNAAEIDLIRKGQATQIEPVHVPVAAPAKVLHYETPSQTIWSALFTSPSLWGLALLYLFGSFGYSFFVSWLPKYFDEHLHVSFDKSEVMSGAPQFLAGITCLLGGWLSDLVVRRTGWRRWGRAIFPITGCATAASAIFALRFVHTPREAVILTCIAAAAYDFGQGANWASIIDVGGAYAGTAAGFINMIGNMGNFIQPVVGAAIFTHLGWPALFVGYAAAYLLSGSMWVFIRPDRRFYEDAATPAFTSHPNPLPQGERGPDGAVRQR